jgi:hypothetical protein
VIILQLDGGKLFIDATVFGKGTLSVGTVHTADFVIHFLTFVDLAAVLISGYWHAVRLIFRRFTESIQFLSIRYSSILLRLYYYFCPSLPLLFYALFFDPFKEYPTGTSSFLLAVIAIFIDIIVMAFLYECISRIFHPELVPSPSRKKIK